LCREVVKRLEGAYVVAGLELPIPGDWQVIIDRFILAAQAQKHLAKLASERYERILQLEKELVEECGPVQLIEYRERMKSATRTPQADKVSQ
jgi:hypothetical protein